MFGGDEIEDFLREGIQVYLGGFMGSLGDFWRSWGSYFGVLAVGVYLGL